MIWCPLRKIALAHTPEEEVRVRLIETMTGDLGYPSHLLVVERQLGDLVRSSEKRVPKRRIDLLAYAMNRKMGSIEPLLLVECKAGPLGEALSRQALLQLLGYNHFVGAPFTALVVGDLVSVVARDGAVLTSHGTLPPYDELCRKGILRTRQKPPL